VGIGVIGGRVVWLAAGVGIGVAVARRLEGSAPASTVEAAATGAVRRAREVVDRVIADGRVEMRQREARLRAVLAAPGASGSVDHARRASQGER
jgi:hypothetical protein